MSVDLHVGPTVDVHTRVDVGPAISPEYVKTISSSAQELEKYLNQLEEDPLFSTMVAAGIISRNARRAGLSYRNSPSATEIRQEIVASEDKSVSGFDGEDPLAYLEDFFRSKNLSRDEVLVFVRGDKDPARVVEHCDCTSEETDAFERAINMHLGREHKMSQVKQVNAVEHVPLRIEPNKPILEIDVVKGQVVSLQECDPWRHRRYKIKKSLLRRYKGMPELGEMREIVKKLGRVNDILLTRSKVALALIERQMPYIESGNDAKLRWVTQDVLAQRLRRHPSNIHRAIGDWEVSINRDGVRETLKLKSLCGPSLVGRVIKALVRESPYLRDSEVCSVLRKNRFKSITVRSVNYHRTKFQSRRRARSVK